MAFTKENRSKLRFGSMPNFRRLDTLVSDDDAGQRNSKLYRSSRPDFLTEKEAISFQQLGIRSIIDFRSGSEYKKANGNKLLDQIYPVYKVKIPLYNKFQASERITYKPVKSSFKCSNGAYQNGYSQVQGKHYLINFFKINYILAVFNRAPWYLKLYSMLYLLVDVVLNTHYRYFVRLFARHVLNKAGLVGQYIDIIRYSQNQIYAALKLLCDENNVPAMLNCAHGKDRTGIVSALVLACFGKSKEYIALDYAKSESELEPMKDRLHDEIVKKFHMCETFMTAKTSSMMEVLLFIEKEYGSIPDYLEHIGFTAQDQAALRKNLLE